MVSQIYALPANREQLVTTLHLGVQCTVLCSEVDKGSSSLYWLPAIFWNNFRRARTQHFHTFKTQNGKPTYVFQMPIYF